MVQRLLTAGVLLMLTLALVPALALAQDVPAVDPLATARAADHQADRAQQEAARRAASLRATAQAGYAQATDQARATATAQVIQAEQTATAQTSQQTATARAAAWTATARAGEVQATVAAWTMDATATAGAYQDQAQVRAVESTAAALRLEREKASRDAARAWQPVKVYAGWLALVALVLAAIWASDRLISSWVAGRRARARAEFEASVVEAEYTETGRHPAGQVQVYLLPEPGQTGLWVGPDGRFWRE